VELRNGNDQARLYCEYNDESDERERIATMIELLCFSVTETVRTKQETQKEQETREKIPNLWSQGIKPSLFTSKLKHRSLDSFKLSLAATSVES
jgi:hypothetical protein